MNDEQIEKAIGQFLSSVETLLNCIDKCERNEMKECLQGYIEETCNKICANEGVTREVDSLREIVLRR